MALMYLFKHQGTLNGKSPDEFSPRNAAKTLRRALHGLATDENVIINILTRHNSRQRLEIRDVYFKLYTKDLYQQFRNELGGHFLESCLTLARGNEVNDAISLNSAIKGVGLDEICLIEILVGRTDAQLKQVADAYCERFGQTLEYDMNKLCRSKLKALFLALIHAKRDNFTYDEGGSLEEDARLLIDNSVYGFLLPKSDFVLLMSHRTTNQMKLILSSYKEQSGVSLDSIIQRRVITEARTGLLAVVQYTVDPVGFYAEYIHACLRGFQSDDTNFIRLIVLRSEIDLQLIKDEYVRKYKESLSKAIIRNCSGDYQRIMLRIIGNVS